MGRCHGVALWMEYHLTDDITVSAGVIGPISEQVSQPSPTVDPLLDHPSKQRFPACCILLLLFSSALILLCHIKVVGLGGK